MAITNKQINNWANDLWNNLNYDNTGGEITLSDARFTRFECLGGWQFDFLGFALQRHTIFGGNLFIPFKRGALISWEPNEQRDNHS